MSQTGRVFRRALRRLTAPISLFGVIALPTAVAQTRPQFTTTVELVQLQVGVEGPRGFVSGLQAKDFELRVDGKVRPVRVVYEVDLRPVDSTAAAVVDPARPDWSRAATPLPVAARRHFLLFFDYSFNTRAGVIASHAAALDFIDHAVHRDDLLSVVTLNRFRLELLVPFTRDHAQVKEALAALKLARATDLIQGGLEADESIEQALEEIRAAMELEDEDSVPVAAALKGAEFREYVAQIASYQLRMRQFAQMLQAIEGRKHVIFFSRGFQDRALTGESLVEMEALMEVRAFTPEGIVQSDPEMLYGSAELRQGLNDLVETLRGADAAIYAVDPGGSRNQDDPNNLNRVTSNLGPTDAPPDMSQVGAGTRQGLTALALDTGGDVFWNRNDLPATLAEIERRTSAYYMLAYQKDPRDDPKVEIRVRVLRSGAQVVWAPTRLRPPPAFADMTAQQRQLQLSELLNDDVERQGISFDSQVVAFPDGDFSCAAVILEIPGLELDRLASMRGDGKVRFEIMALALAVDGTVQDVFRRGLTVDVLAMRDGAPVHGQALRFTEYLTVPYGEARVRLVLREAALGGASTKTTALWVERSDGGISVARPLILSGDATPLPEPEGESTFDPLGFDDRRLSVVAAPRLRAGEAFRLLVVGYHLPRDRFTGEVLAGLVLEAEDAEGNSHLLTGWEIIGSVHDVVRDMTRLMIDATLPVGVAGGQGRLWSRLLATSSADRVEEQAPVYFEER